MPRFLVIGQGVAGSFLTWELLKHGHSVRVVDADHEDSSSIVSAGIINPVTGKRFAVMQEFDAYFKVAKAAYEELEAHFDHQFFEPMNILRIFQNSDERDHWLRKVELNIGQQYCHENFLPTDIHSDINDEWGSVMITQSGFCHTARLLGALKEYFLAKQILSVEKFDYDSLNIQTDHVVYKGNKFDAVVFCEGFKAQWNPWFDWIPFNSVKGEILKIQMNSADLPRTIVNRGKWVAPVDENRWMAGASYIWDQLDCAPTVEGKAQIVSGIKNMLEREIKVIEHKAGVRPVIDDQRVVMGRHPELTSLCILNGLGSKGFLMAPTFAKLLTSHLVNQTPIQSIYDVKRFGV